MQTTSEAQAPEDAGEAVSSYRISAILPIYAEKRVIVDTVSRLRELAGDHLHEIILLVAGAAPEDTLEICRETVERFPGVRLSMQERNPGLGFAVRQGIEEARGDYILLMDCDGEMDVTTVPRMIAALDGGAVGMVVASRWMKGGGVRGYDPIKYVLNRGYQLLFRLLFRTRIHDLTLGFKLVRADIMKGIPWVSQFHDIGPETTLRVIRTGCRVTDVPTVWTCRQEGASANLFRRNFLNVSMALNILFGRLDDQKS